MASGNGGTLSVPSTSGLRDETWPDGYQVIDSITFQYPQPRVYAMKPLTRTLQVARGKLSVPSTSGLRDETLPLLENYHVACLFQYPQPRVYAMKLNRQRHGLLFHHSRLSVPSTSGLRDETIRLCLQLTLQLSFSTLNLGSTR